MVLATPQALQAAHDALDLHDPSVDVAHLSFDSVVDAALDSASDPLIRRLIFEGHGTVIRVLVERRHDESVVAFQIEPPRRGDVTVLQKGHQQMARTDPAGLGKVALRPGLTSLLFGAITRVDSAVDDLSIVDSAIRTAWVII